MHDKREASPGSGVDSEIESEQCAQRSKPNAARSARINKSWTLDQRTAWASAADDHHSDSKLSMNGQFNITVACAQGLGG